MDLSGLNIFLEILRPQRLSCTEGRSPPATMAVCIKLYVDDTTLQIVGLLFSSCHNRLTVLTEHDRTIGCKAFTLN